CARDAAGNFYMTGYTGLVTSSNIATANSHQTALGGGGDAFLVKFDNTGMRLWGTYYGGINNERGLGCAVDITGNIYLSGFTASPGGTVIATNGAHQQNHSMGMDDAFLAMFD